jgi:hypothetical protein
MQSTVQLGQAFGRHVMQLTTELLLQPQRPPSLSHMERDIRAMLVELGSFLLSAWVMMLDEPYPAERIPCPCGAEATYQSQREATLLTIMGQITYKRAYYLCPHCHQGLFPLDQRLGLRPGQMSAELESLAGMTGAQLPFQQGSQLFEALTLISLSDHSLAKATQDMGSEVQAQEQEWIERSHDEQWLQTQQRLAEGPQRLYGSLDGVKVHVRGDHEHPWRELKTGAWFTTTQHAPQSPDEDWEIHATDITYYADICEARTFGDLLWATGCQRQAQLADELIFLGDGAEWIWALVREHYPEAVQIVDWFHATEYIAPVAKAAFLTETEQTAWSRYVRTALWGGDLNSVIHAFRAHSDHAHAGEAARKAVTYFTNNRHRMRYPEYRAKGYQIGSGTIESGCKRIATQRLKVAGAIWNLENGVKTAKARAALLSGQWETITARRQHLSHRLAA